MRLSSIEYTEFPDDDREWKLVRVDLAPINLLVGRNSTGKTRIISLLANLAKMLAGKIKEVRINGTFLADFQHTDDTGSEHSYRYELVHDDFLVTREDLIMDGRDYLHRGGGGIGKIFAAELQQKLRFQISPHELAVVAKSDAFQHPFLQPLHDWGKSVRHFEFGKTMGQSALAIAIKAEKDPTDEFDTSQVVNIFNKGLVYGDAFVNAVKNDMDRLSYPIDGIEIKKPANILILQAPVNTPEVFGLSVKEKNLKIWTDQPWMSQGMFRALALIVVSNYYLLSQTAATFLVDDIGEGLDFERSCELISILREKASQSSVQLIMSTNDRFVMNQVPLEEWCLLRRVGGQVKAYNYANSRELFERFKLTGLSNFDLLASDFLEKMLPNGKNGHLRGGSDGKDTHREIDQGNGG